jgi:glycine cleavage system regulatory protein
MRIQVKLPKEISLAELDKKLDELAEDLNVDITIN